MRDARGIWLKRNLDYEIPSVKDLDDALDFTGELREAAKAKVGKFKTSRLFGSQLECSRVKVSDFLADEQYCFDVLKTALWVHFFPNGANHAPNITSVQYSDFAAFNTKSYPHNIRIFSGDDAFLTFSVQRLVRLVDPPTSDFTPPAGATFMAACTAIYQPKVIKQVFPDYPSAERAAGHTAHVVVYIVIAADGTVQNARVVFPTAPAFAAAALTAVRQWRYQPPDCNGTPAPMETYVSVYFVL